MPIPNNYKTDSTDISSSNTAISSSMQDFGRFYFAENNLDQDLVKSINRELLIKICNQRIYYYAIDDDRTTANIYGESEEKIFKEPKLAWVRVNYMEPTQTLNQFSFDSKYQIELYFYPLLNDEIDLKPRQGDVVRLPGTNLKNNTMFYEIASALVQQPLWGQFDNAMCIKCVCNTARASLVNSISRIENNKINKP